MRKKIPVAIEVAGYLILSCAITIIATMIWQRITQEPLEDVVDTIRWALTLNLLFCSAPTLPSFYLFQRQRFATRMIVPVASLLLQTVCISFFLNRFFEYWIWLCIYFPTLGIVGTTILTASLPMVRKGDFPIPDAKLTLGITAELLLPFTLPPIIVFFFR